MSVRFYMDEHVHAGITNALRLRGVNVVTVQEDGRSGADDPELLDRAMAVGRVMFSQDTDMLRLAAERQAAQSRFGGLIYAHQAWVPIGVCIDNLHLIAEACAIEEFADRVEYLPLK